MISPALRIALVIFAALLCLALSPFAGPVWISPLEALDPASPEYLIFWRLRLPRSLGAFIAGSGLSLCGLAFQALFRNPLATPFTLGISSGAALGAALYSRFGPDAAFPGGGVASGLAGCLAAMLAVYLLASGGGGFSAGALLLAGVIINFFFSSMVMFVQYASNAQDAAQIMRWLMGSLAGISPAALPGLALVLCCGYWIFAKIAPELDLLLAGEELAASRGVDVRRVKLLVFGAGSFLAGIIVAFSGPIGFVGMMIPQICRLLLGQTHARLVPAVFFMGGGFLVVCDLAARTLLAPAELPIGILTSMLGAPFFLWMLYRGDSRGTLL
ncbi:MAG: iron ABC transporter permease [Desulfovibrio sp.]|nr:iron ABC transporter permease [Desulfovibrio sp.]